MTAVAAAPLTTAALRQMEAPWEIHDTLWGPLVPDLVAKLNGFRGAAHAPLRSNDRLVRFLYAHQAEPMPLAEFIERFDWGARMCAYVNYLRLCHTASRRRGQPLSEDWAELFAAMERIVRIADPEPMQSIRDRSVVLCLSHHGVVLSALLHVRASTLPGISVSRHGDRGPMAAQHARVRHLAVGGTGVAQSFLAMTKLVRSTPHVVSIAPDGPDGEQAEHEVLGRRVTFGPGAATLAQRSGAACVTARSFWRGDGFEIVLDPGPSAEPGEDRDAFRSRFDAFYVGHLTQVLTGPPENMRGTGGVFSSLDNTLRMEARARRAARAAPDA